MATLAVCFTFGTIYAERLVLDHIEVEVNGVRQQVPNGGSVTVIRGDKMTVVEAHLSDGETWVENVNVVGFAPPNAPRQQEDRGFEIDTAKDFITRWSTHPDRHSYRVTAYTKEQHFGEITINVEDPMLVDAIFSVGGETFTVRNREMLVVQKSMDTFKVDQINTNANSDDVSVQVVPIKTVPEDAKDKFYEIRFILRGDRVFAAIPIQVKG